MPVPSVRPAIPADVPLILDLIQDLADYERMREEVVGTAAALEAHLFGPNPAAEVLMGCLDGEPVGFALYFTTYSTFLTKPGIHLEDLFVRPAHRGTGLGKALLAGLAAIASARGCGRLEWVVLNWNTPAIEFYQAMGAEPLAGWTTYRVTGETLEALASKSLAP